ncbi:MAG: family transcriptional regulator, cyclic receptor protein [Actinomycetota bacterium]|jgi:CRP-like cAMP-binding protein
MPLVARYDPAVMLDPALLAEVELFGTLPSEAVERVAAAAQSRALRRGDILFKEGDPGDELFVVESGRIAIANKSFDGRESVFALMEAGDVFGEMSLFDGHGRSAEARALEASKVYAVPFEPLRELFREQPSLLWPVVELLAGRIRNMDVALADSVFLDVTGRTAKRLLELAGENDEFQLPITQEELAGLVGASRERVNKAISSFVRLGWLEQRDRRYKITNRIQLERRAR